VPGTSSLALIAVALALPGEKFRNCFPDIAEYAILRQRARLLGFEMRSFVLLASLTLSTCVQAAQISVEQKGGGEALVKLNGTLTPYDGEFFHAQVRHLSNATIAFDSPGGSVLAGLTIGELIHERKFVTVVPNNTTCASACALAWLGGAKRFMGSGAKVGCHAAYDGRDGQEKGLPNALIGAYLTKLGLGYHAIMYCTKAPPHSMEWLDKDQAAKVGIAVADIPHDVAALLSPFPRVAPIDPPKQEARPSPAPAPPVDPPKQEAVPAPPKPPVDEPTKKAEGFWRLNKSVMYLVSEGNKRRFYYDEPRPTMKELGVSKGTLFFDGNLQGSTIVGTAYVFSKRCGPLGYSVTGEISEDQRAMTAFGKSPLVDANCQIATYRDSVIELEYHDPADPLELPPPLRLMKQEGAEQ